VVVVSASGQDVPQLIEWEIVNGSLMRRSGPCPATRPSVYSHALFSDNKTMLENVDPAQSRLSYFVGGSAPPGPIPDEDLGFVDQVRIELLAGLPGHAEADGARAATTIWARVGR
jgi:hypothetical protein